MLGTLITLAVARRVLQLMAVGAPLVALIAANPRLLRRTSTWLGTSDRRTAPRGVVLVGGWLAWLGEERTTTVRTVGRARPSRRDTLTTLSVVAACAIVVAVAQAIWIWKYRTLGTLDWDESRYIAGSLRFRHFLTSGELGQVNLFYGPVLPLVTAVATIAGPVDPRAIIIAQLVVMIGLAVASAGVALRLRGPRVGMVAGAVVCLLPATMASSQVYLLVPGAAFGITAAAWALLTSEHGNNWRIWLVGPLLALAPLSRGMTLGLLPGVCLGCFVLAASSGRGLRRTVLSLSLAAGAVAWFLLTWGWSIVTYVTIGLSVERVQAPTIGDRLGFRWNEVADGFGHPVLLVLLVLAGLGVLRRVLHGPRSFEIRGNPFVAVTTMVLLGGGAFLLGGYFGSLGFWDYPLIPLLAVLLVAVAANARAPLPTVAAVAGVAWMGYVALFMSGAVPLDAPLVGSAAGRYSNPVHESYKRFLDPRFAAERRSEQLGAAAEWTRAAQEIDDRLRDLDRSTPGPIEVYYRGGSNFVENTTEVLAAERDRPPLTYISDPGPDESGNWDAALTPSGDDLRRLLLVPSLGPSGASGRSVDERRRVLADVGYAESQALRAAAGDAGWRIVERIPLPLGDEMLVLAPPSW